MTQIPDTPVQFLDVDETGEGQRIDNYLFRHLKGVPKSHIYRLLRRGEVRVNKGRAKPPRKLKLGDQVRIPPLRFAQADEASHERQPPRGLLEQIEKSILYEDRELLFVNKPSGVAVHGGSGISFGLIELVRQLRPDVTSLELAHRLDRDTSGCLILTKKRSALQRVHALQLEGKITKDYQALVYGRWRKSSRRVDVPLKKNTLVSGERVVRVDAEGKPAVTHFSATNRYTDCLLVNARLETGRTHQIRVHAAHLGSPILGDTKYGNEIANKAFKQLGLNRLFLHAVELVLPWPGKPEGHRIRAPLPADLLTVLKNLDQQNEV